MTSLCVSAAEESRKKRDVVKKEGKKDRKRPKRKQKTDKKDEPETEPEPEPEVGGKHKASNCSLVLLCVAVF